MREAFDAVRLFVNAARRVDPTLVPATEAAAIVDICRQVEGLPLALELAAAWTRVFAVCCDRRRIAPGYGTAAGHRSGASRPAIRASMFVFDQSWRLLTGMPNGKHCPAFSVFRGGFYQAEAARVVAFAAIPVLGAIWVTNRCCV